jgi:dihydrofolate reductase
MRAMGLLTFADDELLDYFAELMDGFGAMLYGRTTYELMEDA